MILEIFCGLTFKESVCAPRRVFAGVIRWASFFRKSRVCYLIYLAKNVVGFLDRVGAFLRV